MLVCEAGIQKVQWNAVGASHSWKNRALAGTGMDLGIGRVIVTEHPGVRCGGDGFRMSGEGAGAMEGKGRGEIVAAATLAASAIVVLEGPAAAPAADVPQATAATSRKAEPVRNLIVSLLPPKIRTELKQCGAVARVVLDPDGVITSIQLRERGRVMRSI